LKNLDAISGDVVHSRTGQTKMVWRKNLQSGQTHIGAGEIESCLTLKGLNGLGEFGIKREKGVIRNEEELGKKKRRGA